MANFDPSKCLALAIGIGKRESDEDYIGVTADDAEQVALLLKDYGKYNNVKALTSKDAITTNITKELDNLVQKSTDDKVDLVVVYFSGHGKQDTNDYYLICHDTNDEKIEDTALKGSEFVSKLNEIKSDKLLVILDCCHAEGVNADIPFPTDDFLKKNNRVIISSSRPDEMSLAGEPVSLFTFALLNGMAGHFLREVEKNVRLFDLAMFTREVVILRNKNQHPQLNILKKNGATTDFTIIHYPTGKNSILPVPKWNKTSGKGEVDGISISELNSIPRDEEYRSLFKPLIKSIKEEIFPLVHFKTIDSLISSSRNSLLFEQNLAFFTPREEEQHQELINYLKTNRTGLLLGHPATGKSIAVVEIAKELQEEGYSVYYHSFKTKKQWSSLLEEMARHAKSDVVFVIDDVHLDAWKAVEAYDSLSINKGNFPNLKILFVSRIVTQINSEVDDFYDNLKEYTVKTEEPSIDEKVEGIILAFQGYYQKNKPERQYKIGTISDVIDRSHRNLIVLREYLKIWEEKHKTTLSELKERELYKIMYRQYFDSQKIALNWEECLIQYLTLYYFEISFYANPQYLQETDSLAQNANVIVKEPEELFSIYHGEYAHLLLLAYESIKQENFRKKYQNWENFCFIQIKNYLSGFDKADQVPENLLEILDKIGRYKTNISGILTGGDGVLKKLIDDEETLNFIFSNCDYTNDEFVVPFISSIGYCTPEFYKIFFEKFSKNDRLYSLKNSLKAFTLGLSYLRRNNIEEDYYWLLNLDEEKILLMLESTSFSSLSWSLVRLFIFEEIKTKTIYHQLKIEEWVAKARKEGFEKIGNALSELYRIDDFRTINIYKTLTEAELADKARSGGFERIGYAMYLLYGVEKTKTTNTYNKLLDDELVKKARLEGFEKIGRSLTLLNRVDDEKTIRIYNKFTDDELVEKARFVGFEKIGGALNELERVDEVKTLDIYNKFTDLELAEKAKIERFEKIGRSLTLLHRVEPKKTIRIFNKLSDDELIKKSRSVGFDKIGNALNELYKVDRKKTIRIYNKLTNDELAEKARSEGFDKIGRSLNELYLVDNIKTNNIYNMLIDDELVEKARSVSFVKMGSTLHELYRVDPIKTTDFCMKIGNKIIIEKSKHGFNHNQFLISISAFAKINPNLGKELVTKISEKELLEWGELSRLGTFNILAYIFQNSKLDYTNSTFRKLLDFGNRKKERFIRIKRIGDLGAFINLMKNYFDLREYVQENMSELFNKILETEENEKSKIATFISTIHTIYPKGTIKHLFNPYKKNNPTEVDIHGFTHFFIGRNLIEEGKTGSGKFHLINAEKYLSKVQDNQETLDEINELLASV